ncbi:hypothetical protein IJG89_01480 [Candidatus Saccharibacteria bacterium]|nr:hypothetical protein [Candidatus Saccharibacteria bacterium]
MGREKTSGKKPETFKQKLSKMKIWQLMVALVLVTIGMLLFVGAVSGWFGEAKVVLDEKYYCGEDCDDEYMELSSGEYEELIKNKESFVVLIDQGGCKTADKVRQYTKDFAKKIGIRVHRMMFEDMKKTSLYEQVKYYPSVVVISKGRVLSFLRADSDEDAGAYNDYEIFETWMKRWI